MYHVLLFAIFFLTIITLGLYAAYSLYGVISGAPYVPTSQKKIKKMLNLSDLKSDEVLMDLGSGDGRIIVEAAKTGARCVGIEINPTLYWLSKIKIFFSRLDNAKVQRTNLWITDLKEVDVLTLYFIPSKMDKLRKKIKKEMRPGSRVVSHAFAFPDWQYTKKDDKVYLYIV